MPIKHLKSPTLAVCFTLCMVSPTSSAIPYGDNVHLSGTLVAEPCALRPGDENIRVDFGGIVDKYLYINGRSPSQAFQLHLQGCDLSIGKQLNVSFSGNESSVLPGLLAVQQTNSGIAVGIEDAGGKAIALNSGSKEVTLEKGDMTLKFAAWIQGEPQAIKAHTIARGEFSAVATFRLDYR
ncbi:fimbrial protein [Erwinia sp. LJJL01]|uniref:fimbrial protein n=1 Tax=Erwinia sp. LJJL01 TaxID=3391839 RepID=UPI0010EF5FAF